MKTTFAIAAIAAVFAVQSVFAKDPAATKGDAATAKEPRAGQAVVRETEAERKARIMEQFDANKDGKLDAQERRAAKAAHKEEKAKRFGKDKDKEQQAEAFDPNAFAAGGANKGGGGLSNASPQFKQALARFDLNRDGQLSPQEMQALQQAMTQNKGQLSREEAMRLKLGLGGQNLPPNKKAGK